MYYALVCQWEACKKPFRSQEETQRYCSQTCGARASGAVKRSDVAIRAYVEERIRKLPGADACWVWTGFVTAAGYGRAFVRSQTHHAHELVYGLFRGAVPEGHVLVRGCETKLCVNPAHRRVSTPDEQPFLRSSFMERVYQPNGLDGCWLWQGQKGTRGGYGRLRPYPRSRRRVFAHRVSYELFVGPIPEGKDILHRCNVPACVNPQHLYPGTQVENGRDRAVAGVMRRVTDLPDEKIVELRKIRFETQMSFNELGAMFHIPPATARAICRGVICKHLDMTYADRSPVRAMSPPQLLTEEDEQRVYYLRTEQLMTYRAIGKLYNVSATRIMKICRRLGEVQQSA